MTSDKCKISGNFSCLEEVTLNEDEIIDKQNVRYKNDKYCVDLHQTTINQKEWRIIFHVCNAHDNNDIIEMCRKVSLVSLILTITIYILNPTVSIMLFI